MIVIMNSSDFKYTPQQEQFCHEYIIDFIAGKAAERAKYSPVTAYAVGSRLLKTDKIKVMVDELLEKKRKDRLNMVTEKRVKAELACLAFVDPLQLFDDAGDLKPLKDIPEDIRRAITSVDILTSTDKFTGKKTTLKKIKLANKEHTLELMARILGMIKTKFEDVTPDKPPRSRPERLAQLEEIQNKVTPQEDLN